MQIDFHHSVTYICARLAGFNHKDADIISYSSQYVDDATNGGTIKFDNGYRYTRISSSNKMKDISSYEDMEKKGVMFPFHFLPGNGGLQKNKEVAGAEQSKVRCTKNSFVAKDMLSTSFSDKNKEYALHRLGIALNVYCDTFVHYGFSGVPTKNNRVNSIDFFKINGKKLTKENEWPKIAKRFFNDNFDEKEKVFKEKLEPIGHTSALFFPDLPYIRWNYTSNRDEKVERRNNAADMLQAAKYMYKVLYTYKRDMNYGSLKFNDIDIPEKEFDKIYENFIKFDILDPNSRHQLWLESINKGEFDFPMTCDLSYKDKGLNSWKHQALGEIKDYETGKEIYKYNDKFLKSNWKLFHDALQAHKFDVVHNVLPSYGICVG